MGTIFFSPRDIHTKGSLDLLHSGLEGITEVDNDPEGAFVSFKVTALPLVTELCVNLPSGYSTLEQLTRVRLKGAFKLKRIT